MNYLNLTVFALAMYMAAAICCGAALFIGHPNGNQGSEETPKPSNLLKALRPLLYSGLLAQFLAVGLWCVQTKRSPFAGDYGSLAVMAWATALTFAIVDLRRRLPALGAMVLFVACLMLFWGIAQAGGTVSDAPYLSHLIVSLHVLATVISFGLFTIGGTSAAIYLWQRYLLKHPATHRFFRRLPPLATLDNIAFHAVAFALPFLTLGLGLGFLYLFTGDARASFSGFDDTKVMASVAAWLLYIVYMVMRLAAGWRGHRLQYLLVVGLIVSLMLFALPGSIHSFR